MKNRFNAFFLATIFALSLSSCFTYTYSVGEGAKTGVEYKKMNHYVINGLAPLNISDPNELAGGAEDYDVTITHTFIDGLIAALTFGIYTPTTTIVRK